MSNNQKVKVEKIKQENIVFESKNGTNTIIDNGSTYILSHKNGICCCFDKDKKILKRVIKAIEQDGNFQVNNSNKLGFYIADKTGKMIYCLNQLIICTAYHKKMKEIKKGLTKYVDGNMLNCCLDNLDCTAVSTNESIVCNITHDNKLIYVHCKNSNVTGILDYTPELYEILSLPKFRWTYNKGIDAITSPVLVRRNKRKSVSLYQLAYVYYNYQNVNMRNIISQIHQFKINCSKNELQVDHLDSVRLNERQYNLSLMDRFLNTRKSNITAKIIYPYFHYGIYVNGIYRVAIGMYAESDRKVTLIMQAYQCNTAQLYVDLLREFYNEGVLPNGERLPVLPKKWYLKTPQEKRQPIEQALSKIDKEDIIDRLLKADMLPLYGSGNDKGAA